ncbi:MAG TPA: DUF222 domain-containing protein [Polyangia bacterium]|jgi:Domain of unknown function DUF222.|nr:DUF222 domain-containing protein [Polyangia bacterium]
MFSVEDLSREIADLAAHMDAATHRLLTCIRQFDEAGGWYEQGAASCASWLAWRIGLDSATAREKVRVARALGKLPVIDEALRASKLSYAKARALTRVATPETEAKLLELAVVATGAQLERLCRGYRRALAPDEQLAPEERSVRRRDLPGGMVRLEIVLAPDEADLLLRALDRAREVVHEETDDSAETQKCNDVQDVSAETSNTGSTWPSRADGMVALAENFLAGNPATGNGGERFQVMVHVDQDPLAPDGVLSASLDDGTRVSAETFRRIACDCGVVAATGDGAQLSIGRRARSIPPAIRRALALRDRGCRFPGCTHTRFLHGHHIQHWLHGGETSVSNLALLCAFHHHLVHEGGWTVARGLDGELTFTAPDGCALQAEPPQHIAEDVLDSLHEWAADRGLDLGPDSNLPLWDGTRPDYDWAVGALLRAG